MLLVTIAAASASRAGDPALAPLEDRIQLIVYPHYVLAIDGKRREERRVSLRVGERVLATASDGLVGIVRTEQRLLAVAVGSGSFQEVRFHLDEQLAGDPELGDGVALAVTNRRVLGFEAGGRNWVEGALGPRERVLATAVANFVAAAVTDRRVFGLSPKRGGFFEATLAAQEPVLSLEATGDLATLRTPTRLLLFRAADGRWTERSTGLGY